MNNTRDWSLSFDGLIGEGSRRFWIDNWIGHRLGGPQPTDGTLTVADVGLHILEDLSDFLSPPDCMRIQEVVSAPDRPDRLLFTATDSGKFSLKAFLDINRTPSGIDHPFVSSLRSGPRSVEVLRRYLSSATLFQFHKPGCNDLDGPFHSISIWSLSCECGGLHSSRNLGLWVSNNF